MLHGRGEGYTTTSSSIINFPFMSTPKRCSLPRFESVCQVTVLPSLSLSKGFVRKMSVVRFRRREGPNENGRKLDLIKAKAKFSSADVDEFFRGQQS